MFPIQLHLLTTHYLNYELGTKAETAGIEETAKSPTPNSLEPAASDRGMAESRTGECAKSRETEMLHEQAARRVLFVLPKLA